MKTLTYKQDIRENMRGVSVDVGFTDRFVKRNVRALDTVLKSARASLRRGKNIAIRTHSEFRRAITVK